MITRHLATRFSVLVLVVFFSALAVPQNATAQSGTIVTFDVPGAAWTGGASINASGTIAGSYYDVGGGFRGFLRNSDGSIILIDAPGAGQGVGQGTYVIGINDAGTIFGYYTPASNLSSYLSFVRDSAGNFTTFALSGATTTEALAFNNAGQTGGCALQAVGCLYTNPGRGFVRDAKGNMISFVPPGAFAVEVRGGGRGVMVTR